MEDQCYHKIAGGNDVTCDTQESLPSTVEHCEAPPSAVTQVDVIG